MSKNMSNKVIAAAEVMLMMMFKHYIPLSPKNDCLVGSFKKQEIPMIAKVSPCSFLSNYTKKSRAIACYSTGVFLFAAFRCKL